MAILIRNMDMPECCGYCPFEHKQYCMAKPSIKVESADRHPNCPLIEVKEPNKADEQLLKDAGFEL